jgi:hypothetical protein
MILRAGFSIPPPRDWKDEGHLNACLAEAEPQPLLTHGVPCGDALLERAAAIKACHPLSVADSWIAAVA